MLNSYGNNVKPRIFNTKEINNLIANIVEKIAVIADVLGIMLTGSITEHKIDCYMDLDLSIFSKTKNLDSLKRKIYVKYKQLGAQKDNFKSIHSPFDDFSFQFNNIYVETELYRLLDLKNTINNTLSGEISDNGLIYSIQHGQIIYDKQQDLHKLQKQLKKLSYPTKLIEVCVKKYEAVSLKLLCHSINRGDYPSAYFWLWGTFFDTTKILCAKNKTFMPATKRLLLYYIPSLKKVPDGYIDFWHKIFKKGPANWKATYKQALHFMLEVKSY